MITTRFFLTFSFFKQITKDDLKELTHRRGICYFRLFNNWRRCRTCKYEGNNKKWVIFLFTDARQKFWRFLLRKNLPNDILNDLDCAVIGLGDSSYRK